MLCVYDVEGRLGEKGKRVDTVKTHGLLERNWPHETQYHMLWIDANKEPNTILHLFLCFVSVCLSEGKPLPCRPCGGQRTGYGSELSLSLSQVWLRDKAKVSRLGDKVLLPAEPPLRPSMPIKNFNWKERKEEILKEKKWRCLTENFCSVLRSLLHRLITWCIWIFFFTYQNIFKGDAHSLFSLKFF